MLSSEWKKMETWSKDKERRRCLSGRDLVGEKCLQRGGSGVTLEGTRGQGLVMIKGGYSKGPCERKGYD